MEASGLTPCCTLLSYLYPRHTNDIYALHSSAGDPLYVGMDLTIASFDSISEVNMVSGFATT